MDISAYRLAKETALSQTRVSQIIRGQRSISAETALRLSKYFGNSAEFWLGLQNDYDLEESRLSLGKELESIRTLSGPGRPTAADRERKGASAAIGRAAGVRTGHTKT
jgi:addiction module HigA family antidote